MHKCILCQINRRPSPNQYKTDIYVFICDFSFSPPPLLQSSQKFTFDGQMVIFFFITENIQIHFTILDRFCSFRTIFFEKMWFCHLFSKYDILKRSLNSLNYYYLIFLSRISTCFILYAFCHICIHTYEIKRNFCEKEIFYRITSLGV